MKRKFKFTIEDAVKILEELGYELIDEVFINANGKITTKDKNGYLYYTTLSQVQNGSPLIVSKANIYTIQNIKLWCILNNKSFELISKTYNNPRDNLIWKCHVCNKEFESCWNSMQQGQNCNICNRAKIYSIDEVKLMIQQYGYTLVSEKYEKNIKNLIIKDDNYYYNISLNNLLRGKTPYFAHISNPYSIQNIKTWLKLNNKNFELLSDRYEGCYINLKWKCLKDGCGEIFDMDWTTVHSGNNCPYCRGYRLGLSNCLMTKNPELAKEWHPILNGDLTPYDVTAGNDKMAWWICKECGHEWYSGIGSRNTGVGCPECKKSKGEKRIETNFIENGFIKIDKYKYKLLSNKTNIYFIPQMTFSGLVGMGSGLLSYDFYLPQYNLLIEYQGEQHEHYCKGAHSSKKDFEKQQEHDKRKKDYAKQNNYKLLEIWYYDFDRIEEILNKELNIKNLELESVVV
jgi:hypothetical protein